MDNRMDNKEAIIQAAIELIEEKGKQIDEITVRDICKKAGVGLGLVNYHFGNKDALIEQCVERMVSAVVEQFQNLQQTGADCSPFEKIEYLGNLTIDFLFDHPAISRISAISDMKSPSEHDNTSRTFEAYLPLVAECRPDLDDKELRRRTLYLVTIMQQVFVRQKNMSQIFGVDLGVKENRHSVHAQILHDILGGVANENHSD